MHSEGVLWEFEHDNSSVLTWDVRGFPQSLQIHAGIVLNWGTAASFHILSLSLFTRQPTTAYCDVLMASVSNVQMLLVSLLHKSMCAYASLRAL
jgi:hypothetical protein